MCGDFLNGASIRTLESILSQEERKGEIHYKGTQKRYKAGSLLVKFIIIQLINDHKFLKRERVLFALLKFHP